MKRTIRIVSSPRFDYLLSPSEYRRYSNQIIGYFAFFFVAILYITSKLFFYEDNFFKLAFDVSIAKNQATMDEIRLGMFYFKSALCILPALGGAYFGMQFFTKPTNRQTIINGNFIDDSPEVFQNLARDFRKTSLDDKMCLMRKGEVNPNAEPTFLKKKPTIPYDIYLPRSVLELSLLMSGEAGAGKSVWLNRYWKEVVLSGRKLILHNIKGDEFKLLDGFCSFYLIEPWNKKAGYAINFMQIVAKENEQERNAYIRTFVNSFVSKSSSKDDFFNDGAKEIIFALVKKVVEDNMRNGECKATLKHIVDLWVSFQADTQDDEIDPTNPKHMLMTANQKASSMEKIKRILIEKNPTQADLIDPENAKTSLCILATATKTIKKFSVLAEFWGNREEKKSLDLVKWLNNPKDRQVLLLSNSNIYSAEAEAYISAVINLLTVFVINPEYKPIVPVHFVLDEFPQLRAIDIYSFMKLIDVGRGKLIRVAVSVQRLSQVKDSHGIEPSSFGGGFQSKIFARMATDDFDTLNKTLGRQTIIETSSTTNFNATGSSGSSKTNEKEKDVCNPADLQNMLGPIELNGKFVGVRVAMKFSNINRVAVAIFPPVDFPKKKKRRRVKSLASNSGSNTVSESNDHAEREEVELAQKTPEHEVIINENLPVKEREHEDKNPICDAVAEQLAHAVLNEPTAIIFQSADIIEAMKSTNENTNTAEIGDDEASKLLSRIKSVSRNSKDKNIDKETVI